jgi:hypothetical protein|tara:strand:+ start:1188 stop:1397 length:210 start_codon:yes stop_codon:yes gene_type:complete
MEGRVISDKPQMLRQADGMNKNHTISTVELFTAGRWELYFQAMKCTYLTLLAWLALSLAPTIAWAQCAM